MTRVDDTGTLAFAWRHLLRNQQAYRSERLAGKRAFLRFLARSLAARPSSLIKDDVFTPEYPPIEGLDWKRSTGSKGKLPDVSSRIKDLARVS
jgi:hypothetical protein